MTIESSFVLEAARLCVLEITLAGFGPPDTLLFRVNTDGVEVLGAAIVPTPRSGSNSNGAVGAVVAVRWRARPSMFRLVCRSENISAAMAVSNFETTSLAQFAATADPRRLLALVDVLRSVGKNLLSEHAHVLNRIREIGRREFFLNWLPAAQSRFVCMVCPTVVEDPGALELIPLNPNQSGIQSLWPVSHVTVDGYAVLVYDLNGVGEPNCTLELASVIQDAMHYWRLTPAAVGIHVNTAEAEHLVKLARRWTTRVCEAIATSRADVLITGHWQVPEPGAVNFRFQSQRLGSAILVVTDVVDMFGLTTVMAAAERWKGRFARIFLLIPSWSATASDRIGKLNALLEDFGGTAPIEPITVDELNCVLHSLETGMSVSFASAAAHYNTLIDDRNCTALSTATFDISSPGRLTFLKEILHYSMLAGGPLVWRELQSAFSDNARERASPVLLPDGQAASLVDDLYAGPYARLGWPLGALQHFDRQMFATLRNREAE